MKKNIRNLIVSLALCTSASCVVGGVSFLRSKEQVASAAATSAYYTLDGFTIDETASIRNTSPNGIRFQTVLSEETQSAIDGLGLSDVSYGTLMLPADMLGTQELTHETKSVLDVETNYWQDEEETTWTSVLVGSNGDLSESYYNRPIAARSYVSGTDAGGNTVYYYTENTALRSIGYVAMMEYLSAPEEATELIETIVEKTDADLVFNDAGMISAMQSSKEGTTLISNALSVSSDAVVAFRIGGMITTNAYDFLPEITYSVENEAIIGIDGSTLTAKYIGETVVTASSTFNGKQLSVSKMMSTSAYQGKSDYKILITEEANASPDIQTKDFEAGGHSSKATFEKVAAKKLQSILLEATGVELPIVTKVEDGDKYISVGETTEAKEYTTLDDDVAAKETAAQVFVVGGNVYLRGSVANESIYYGVQYFLGDLVDYDFFMENAYTYTSEVEVAVQEAKYIPDIEYNVIQSDLRTAGVMEDYKMQSYTHDMIALGITEDEENSGFHYKGTAHNSTYVVNAGTSSDTSKADKEQYCSNYDEEAWGKWYATTTTYKLFVGDTEVYRKIDDPNTDDTDYIMAELCYTAHGDTDARNAMIGVVVAEMEEELAQYTDRDRLGFSIMDHRIWCECSSCKAQGSASDNLLAFLLDVADALEDRFGAEDSELKADDPRKDTFRIASLFYHCAGVEPTSTSDYADALSANGKHIEIWFAESAGDYTVGIDSTASNINQGIYANIQAFSTIAKANSIDLFWWGYYGMATQFFVPYDSIDALRVNYGIAEDLGVYSMFNQMMQSKVNFTRLKEYLMSKLMYEAKPNDTTWNGWIVSYFDGAYGAGAENMQAYYAQWKAWAEKYNNTNSGGFLNSYTLAEVSSDPNNCSDASIWEDTSLGANRTTYYPQETLENWLALIDQGIAALDPNDPNFEAYYWNMKLEKLTPLYLMLYVYGGNNSSNKESSGMVTDGSFTTAGQSYVQAYGQEFLDICEYWGVDNYGEGNASNRSLSAFKEGIKTILSNATSTEIDAKHTVLANAQSTLKDDALVDGTYAATFTSANKTVKLDSVSVSGGEATFTADLTAGETYVVELKNGATIVKFNNVLAISGYITSADELKALSGDGYYVLANDINCASATLHAISFAGILDGDNKTISNFTVGANGIFSAAATVKNVTFADFTVAGETATQKSVFGAASSFENVNVTTDNANLNSAWSNGINVNYETVSRNAYVVRGTTTTTLYGEFVKGNTYTVTVDGVDATYTAYSNGKLVNVKVGSLLEGAKKAIICRDSANGVNYGFDVIGITKFITTAQELKDLGVGGKRVTALDNSETVIGNGAIAGENTEGYYVLANDIDATDVAFAAGYGYVDAYFKGTFDGDGHTVSNVKVGEGGIFGSVQNAAIKNVSFENVMVHANGGDGFSSKTNAQIGVQYDKEGNDISASTAGSGLNNNLQWGFYTAILGYSANNVEVSNISIQVSEYINKSYYGRTSLLFVANHGTNSFNDISINAAGLDVSSVLGAYVDEYDTYSNVNVYVGTSQMYYSPEGMDDTSAKDTMPSGVNYIETSFRITNEETEIAAGETLTLTTNDDTATFELVDAPNGVDLVGAELFVGEDVAHNSKITVKATADNVTATYTLTVVSTTELDNTVEISIEDKTMAISNNVKGEVQSVTLDGTVLYDGTGDVQYVDGKGIYTLNDAVANIIVGEYDNLFIKTSTARYAASARVITKYIRTLEDLKTLGVGGNNPTMTQAGAKDITGYYVLANDIDVAAHEEDYSDMVAAGYPYFYGTTNSLTARFKGTFDGDGHTINNLRVSDGGIFGRLDGKVKNVNFTNVYYVDSPTTGVSNQNGGYVALLAHSTNGATVENVNVTVASAPADWTWRRIGMLVCTGSNGNVTYRNVTLDAGGLKLKNILGISVNSGNVYDNVTVIANGYTAIGYNGDSYGSGGVDNEDKKMSAFPTGIEYVQKASASFVAVDGENTKNEFGKLLSVYEGDVTELGFAEGTTVYEQVQDNRTDMWGNATNGGLGELGLSMEQQGIRLQKAADEDYASVQFSINREFSGTHAFFAWIWMPNATQRITNNQYVKTDGTGTNEYVKVFDLNGNKVNSFELGKAYEMRWYHEGAIAFRVGCCEQNGESITIYYANPSSGNDAAWERNDGALLPTYEGNVTELGFDAGTNVVEADFASDWDTAYAKRVHIGKLPSADLGYTYMDIQFAVSKNASFTLWDGCAGGGTSYVLTATGCVENENKGFARTVQILDKEGNPIELSQFAANTVYTLRVYLYDTTGAAHYVGNWQMTSQSDVVLYLGNVTYGTIEQPDQGGDDEELIEETLSETVLVDLANNVLTLPEIDGTVKSITVSGITVYDSTIGSIDGNVVKLGASLTTGADQEIIIKTDTTAYTGTATVATKIITTTQELRDLGVGGKVYTDRQPTYNNSNSTDAGAGGNANSGVEGNDVTGYYVLGNDLDFAGEKAVAAGYTWNLSWFKATFDGNGHTIKNITVNEGGIFGSMRNATVKNVNFTGVVIDLSLGIYAGQYSQQAALFAHVADSSKFENIDVQISSYVQHPNTSLYGATFVHTYWNTNTVTNMLIDAAGVTLDCVMGTDEQGKVSYENVTIKAADYRTIGKKAGAELTSFPTGVTFKLVSVPKTNTGVSLPTYDGDVTALGFAEGTTVYTATHNNDVWSDRIVLSVNDSYKYAEFDIVLGATCSYLQMWPAKSTASTVGQFQVYTDKVVISSGVEVTAMIFDANGNSVTSGSFAASTRYTVRLSINDAATNDQYHFVPAATQTYYVTGLIYVTELDETSTTLLADSIVNLPSDVMGNVELVRVDGKVVYSKAAGIGSLEKNVVTIDETVLADLKGGEYVMDVVTDTDMDVGVNYTSTVILVTKYIETLEDLKAIGVGGNNTAITATSSNVEGYYVLANDISITHEDDYSDLVAAGYPKYNDTKTSITQRFKGTFDGSGYTIDNMRVSDGGIFGIMDSATVKNVNFTNVHYLRDVTTEISNEQGGYIALLAYKASKTTFEDITITVASVPDKYSWKRMGTLVVTSGDGVATFRNVTLDASGLVIDDILGIYYDSAKYVFENVVIKAAGYYAIGYTADSYKSSTEANTEAMLSEFPTGIKFETGKAIKYQSSSTETKDPIQLYSGDVRELGFAAGTKVWYVEQDNRGTGWGVTGDKGYMMEQQKILIEKDADEDYASVLFSLSRELTGNLFFAWGYGEKNWRCRYAYM